MTDPNVNATPESVSDKLDGQVDGQPLPYDEVDQLGTYGLFSLTNPSGGYKFPEGENVSSSFIDHDNTTAKVVDRFFPASDGNKYDLYDGVMTILKWVLQQDPHINDDEPASVNHKAS